MQLSCGSDDAPQYAGNKDGGAGKGGSGGGTGGSAGASATGGMAGSSGGATGGGSGAGGTAGQMGSGGSAATDGGKSCTGNPDCQDGNPCNGDEACSGGFCTSGTQLADGTACSSGVDAGSDGGVSNKCVAGSCLATCAQDKDCDDNNPCTGTESCNPATKICQSGSPLVCTDTSPCTENECDPDTGCTFPLIDMDADGHAASSLGSCGDDCNDNDKTIFTGAQELCDSKDNNCNNQTDETAPTWYADCDGDGFSPAGAPNVAGCTKPAAPHSSCAGKGGWTSLAPTTGQIDCWDGDGRAHPFTTADNGTAWQPDVILNAPTTIKRYDFNCDGTDEPRYTVAGADPAATCSTIKGGFCGGLFSATGWTSSAAPGCGFSGTYTYCGVDRVSGLCRRINETRPQQCR